MTLATGFVELINAQLGETPIGVGESFNQHYATSNAFIKVSRPNVLPFRATNDVYFAGAMAEAGVPTAKPLIDHPLSFQDEAGYTRWVTLWEKKVSTGTLSVRDASILCQGWIQELWKQPLPIWTTELSLDSFLHAAHVRLDGSKSHLREPLLDAIEEASLSIYYRQPSAAGLLHGDLHNGNLMVTEEGVLLIDWESACAGPKEWDAAQNLRYADPVDRAHWRQWWLSQKDIDGDALDFYYKLRSLTSMTHFVANDVKNYLYHQTAELMGWTP